LQAAQAQAQTKLAKEPPSFQPIKYQKMKIRYLITVCISIAGLTVLGQPKSIQFEPTTYYNNFSHKFLPVLKVQPGDTIKSASVDAGGFNKLGSRVAKSGNPVTGPFFIVGASPGDILAITLTSVSLNRDYATTVGSYLKRSVPLAVFKENFDPRADRVRWKLIPEKGYAKPELEGKNLSDFTVPLHPFLGCVGLAAPLKSKEPLTYYAGEYGGNMDFRKVTTGATIYIPVFHEGGLLYLGDGHAQQGDGEINGDALETSMDFAFVATVIKGQPPIKFPRIEDAEHIVAMAMGKSLEEASQNATFGLLEWIQSDYGLTAREVSQVIGPLIEYRIPSIASPDLEIAAMIKKNYLTGLKRKTK
jgi:acetamidase/formamidase